MSWGRAAASGSPPTGQVVKQAGCLARERSYSTRKKSNEVVMTAINKQPARHEIEELLPWYATGTLNGRDAERVEQALAGDGELAHRYELVRGELAEITRLNEMLGVPSPRAMEKLFAAINAEEARAPRPRPIVGRVFQRLRATALVRNPASLSDEHRSIRSSSRRLRAPRAATPLRRREA